ncbi:zinc-dependent alcohol dehydrogenase family protein [Jidongwangia harbinensis]|uniref:zinc-dependent alcohol dehydrogenase family protein n=1 Tax=Jidongwangia harbinensis TaxID=2878561 RepID=UPI001CDA0F81|nr:zinc-dependent alcohol dehydrogenase family protein [Jidongwangia harbinensis]MCA2217548.1 zinc-dependent alcohol dehydrogenase family protein [Jidongwangia harbinensis]
MRAVVYDAVGAAPRMASVPEPECAEDGAVVAVRATGVCRSDWHAWRGHEPVPLPHTPGHEFAGVVAAVGARVRGFAVGDRVTSPFVNGCGRCAWCLRGQAQVCPDQTQPGFTQAGSFAERVAVHAADLNLVRLPESIDFVEAAALGCRFATAFRALHGHGRIGAGDWVAVFGCGGVGLSAVMIAVASGARVVGVDPSPAARARAAELGAEVTLAPDAPPSVDATVRAVTDGGAQVSVDALGSAATADASIRSLRRRGRHVQVGLMLGDAARAPIPWTVVVEQELEIVGSHGMAAADYPAMLAMVADGRLRPRRLVGRVIGLAEAGAALVAMDDPVAAGAGITVATTA